MHVVAAMCTKAAHELHVEDSMRTVKLMYLAWTGTRQQGSISSIP